MGLAWCVTMGIDEDKQVEVSLDGCRRLLRLRREDALSGRDIRGSISFIFSQILLLPLVFKVGWMDIVQVLASSAEEVRRPLSREEASSRSSGFGCRHGCRPDYS